MCIVIDANTIACVFEEDCKKHNDFRPVKNWIYEGGGKMVVGGTKFKSEIYGMRKYAKVFKLLKDARKLCEIVDSEVDNKEQAILKMTAMTNCNDQHVIALISVSGCRLVCSEDKASFKYLKDCRFYPKGKRPKIYSSKANKKLLTSNFIVKLSSLV